MNKNFIERLQYYMDTMGINDNQMTIAADLSIGLLGKLKKNGKGMNSTNIEKILSSYPDLNAEWLLTGRGSMLKSSPAPTLCGEGNLANVVSEISNKDIENPDNQPTIATNNSIAVGGNSNSINSLKAIQEMINEIAAQRKMTEKALEQVERLVGVIEKLSNQK